MLELFQSSNARISQTCKCTHRKEQKYKQLPPVARYSPHIYALLTSNVIQKSISCVSWGYLCLQFGLMPSKRFLNAVHQGHVKLAKSFHSVFNCLYCSANARESANYMDCIQEFYQELLKYFKFYLKTKFGNFRMLFPFSKVTRIRNSNLKQN